MGQADCALLPHIRAEHWLDEIVSIKCQHLHMCATDERSLRATGLYIETFSEDFV